MSLLSRLILTFVAVVSLLLAVGAMSYLIQRQIGGEVADLRPSRGVNLEDIDLENTHLEIEGTWDGTTFVAQDVTVGPGPRRPKLRGEIQSLDSRRRALWMYGVPIDVTPLTEFPDEVESAGFESLKVGARIEVSATVEGGRWAARKIRTRGVKSSDKIKGTPSASPARGSLRALQTVNLDGITVSVKPASSPSPNGALRQAELATEISSMLEESRAAAHAVVVTSRAWNEDDETPMHEAVGPSARLEEALEAIESTIARSGAVSDPASSDPTQARPLLALQRKLPEHRRNVKELRRLSRVDADRARAFLEDVFEPFLQNEMLALVYANRREAEDELATQVRRISEQARTMTGLVLGASILATAVAIGLAALTWRSIRAPLRALELAASRIGQGHLDTRVEIDGPQELEVLADAFNQMASDLAATTVSVRNLEDIFDSMASVLILLDEQKRITEVNRATEELLGYGPGELVGKPFDLICRTSPLEELPADSAGSTESILTHSDGSEVSVSFSAAAIGSRNGHQGHVCVAQDLRERKRIEERLRATVAEKELLLREVHHRVKNNMQVVSSLLAIHTGYLTDETAIQRFEDCQNQIRSMALIHEQLHTSQQSAIDLPGYLRVLGSHLLQSFGCISGVHLEVEADPVRLRLDQALVCGLIVNELVTNALRHAFDAGEGGKIIVALHEDRDGKCVLSVIDDGRGWSGKRADDSDGLGISLVETLVKQLSGQLHVKSNGGLEVWAVFTPDEVAT